MRRRIRSCVPATLSPFVGVAAVLVIATLAIPHAQQVPVFRAGVDIVNLGVTVSDKKGNLITNLKSDDFEIIEDGKKQALRYFSLGVSGAAVPEMHLGLLIDVSGSMGPSMPFMRTAAIRFLNALPNLIDVTVVDFDGEVRAARYQQNDFPRLIERIRHTKVGGTTALYDAIGVYLDGASGQDGRKIMLLYTDGADTTSSMNIGDLVELLKASDVTVYCIGRIERVTQGTIGHMAVLSRIAEVTGGISFFPSTVSDLDMAYQQVLREIKAQYTLGYVSTNEKTDGSWRKVEIKLASKEARDFKIKARNGYYAPYKSGAASH